MNKRCPTDDIRRRYTMSRIKSKNTSIEVALRKALWHSGIRYRKNYAGLPGAPDIAITKYGIAVFCDGDFWHGNDWEAKKNRLNNNREYWIEKIERNMRRDCKTDRLLYCKGWAVVRFWGSDIRKDLGGCVREIEHMILQSKMDRYDGGE